MLKGFFLESGVLLDTNIEVVECLENFKQAHGAVVECLDRLWKELHPSTSDAEAELKDASRCLALSRAELAAEKASIGGVASINIRNKVADDRARVAWAKEVLYRM
jgi:hypothetical protein